MHILKVISLITLFFISIFSQAQVVEAKEKIPIKQETKSTIDLAVVREKIQVLGLRDDTLESHEQPLRWLKKHREEILPQLIAGLDNPKKRIASGCLEALNGIIGNEDFLNALLRISSDKEHPINIGATLSLCAFAKNEQAKKILEKALFDTDRFSNPQDRATIAEALERKTESVSLLVPLLESKKEEYQMIQIIRRLGSIGDKSAIAPLKKMSHDSHWSFAVESYLAMANIDSDKHGLTQDQKTFLINSRRSFKANRPTYMAHWKKLAELNKKEVRPFVMQMISSDYPEPALIVLQMWRDTEALPEVEKLMKGKSKENGQRRAFIAAYLDIEGTDKSITDVISLASKSGRHSSRGMLSSMSSFDSYRAEDVILAVTQSIMSDERKLIVLRRFRDKLGPQVIAKNLPRGGGEKTEILSSLMAEETNIPALGEYVRAAAQDKEKRFGKEVHDALELLSSKDVLSSDEVDGARLILDGCAAYKLPGSGKLADKFLSPDLATYIRIAAAHVSATLGGNRREALKVLYEGLKNSDPEVRKQSSSCLVSTECLNNTEQVEREDVILSHLGLPTEDYALRVLTTCAGKKTARQLLPILDEESVPRAVYAAWVLAHHPDKTIKQKALRRVAIYGMFNHHVYQAGAGIDFAIAPDMSFHQITENLNRSNGQQQPGPAHIPDDLLAPFEFDGNEQDFFIRVYRYSRLNIIFPPHYLQSRHGISWDASHLPLFRVISHEDPHLCILHVKGKKVAHFKNRKTAAEIIVDITKVKASYTGLAGEEIDSTQVPLQPYENQNKLIARHILDQIEIVGICKQSQDNHQYNRREALERMIRNFTNELGDKLENELIAESNRRNITSELEDARLSIWRKVTE